MAESLDDMLGTAVEAARKAGVELIAASDREIEVIREEAGDIKLVMDRRAEEIIVGMILDRFPEHRILAEERGADGGQGDVEWVIDPLDGTTNYSRRIPNWCVCIGAVRDGEPVVGVVYDPLRNDLFTGRQGGGAFLNGKPLRVSDRTEIPGSVIAFGIYHRQQESIAAWLDRTRVLALQIRSMRDVGSAGLHMAYVAAGMYDAFVEYAVFPWDVTAGIVLVQEAGGKATHWPIPNGGLDIVAAAPGVHDALLATGMWPRTA